MELFLHIGSHKADSTSIQTFLKRNKERLNSSDCAAPAFSNYKSNWQIAAWAGYPNDSNYYTDVLRAFTEEDLKLHSENFDKTIIESIENKKAKGCKKFIILSGSLYSGCSTAAAVNIISRLLLQHFDNITLIFYYRPQISLIKSACGQLVRGLHFLAKKPQSMVDSPLNMISKSKNTLHALINA
jgi:hypothetical protein